MPDDTTRIPEPDTAPDKEKRGPPAQGDRAPPRAGRTGAAGARAERPAEGSTRNANLPPPGRGAKAPSAKDKAGAQADEGSADDLDQTTDDR